MKQDRSEPIAILKSLWRKNEAGVWAIHDADYFKIDDEMVLLTNSRGPWCAICSVHLVILSF